MSAESSRGTEANRPQLKIVWGEDADTWSGSASIDMRLSDFFREWFVPNALEGEGRSDGTISQHWSTIHYWVKLTGDPPLRKIDEFTISQFAKGLRSEVYTRSRTRDGRIMPGAKFYPLGVERVSVHLKNLRAILNRVGEQRQAGRPTARLSLPRFFVPCPTPYAEPGDCFTLQTARQMILASAQFQPARSPDLNWSKFWKGYLGGLLVVGERPGTIRLIDRQMFFRKPDGWWLKLPAELVPKTHKGRWMALPDWCAEAMLGAGNGNLILDCGVHRRTLHDYHEWLQRLAGVGEAEILPQKAWRRTHDAFMQRLGAGIARDVGQRTLNHSHHSTTTAHYFDITEELRRLLPCIWEEPPPPITTPQLLDRQLRLF